MIRAAWKAGTAAAVLGAACAGAQAQQDTGNAAANAVTGALRGVTNLFGRGAAPRPVDTATSTLGIRGLGAEDIAQAQPNPQAVGQMEALRASEAQARGFASAAALSPVAVDPLPAPARTTAGPGQ